MSQFIDIYNDMLNANYSIDDIKLYFLIEHNIDILDFQHELKLNRFGQNYFRKCILSRFNNKCLILRHTKLYFPLFTRGPYLFIPLASFSLGIFLCTGMKCITMYEKRILKTTFVYAIFSSHVREIS